MNIDFEYSGRVAESGPGRVVLDLDEGAHVELTVKPGDRVVVMSDTVYREYEGMADELGYQ